MTNIFLSFFEISVSISLIVVVLILFTPFLNKRYASKWKYWIWIFLSLQLVIPFSGIAGKLGVDMIIPNKKSDSLKSEKNMGNLTGKTATPKRIVVEIPEQMTTPITIHSSKSNIGITIVDIVAFVWITGSLVFIFVHLISYLHYKSQVIKRGTIIKDTCILHQIFKVKRELHIKCRVHAVEYSEADSPMIIGFFKPVLILPKEQYSTMELYFILKHELVHWKHKDVHIKLLFVVANAVHWFNPLIWIMQKEAVIDMELSCDERVTQGTDYAVRKAYTETLLSMLHKQHKKRTVLSTQFYGGTQIMKRRFKNILNKTRNKNGAAVLICTIILSVSLGTLAGCSVANKNTEDLSSQSENADILMGEQDEDVYGEPENISSDGSLSVTDTPQNGQIYGYISNYQNGSVTIDQQIWEQKYNEEPGFEVVDIKGGDITYPLCEDCTFSVLENHCYPIIKLDVKEFANYLQEMEYPVLWVIELKDGQIINVMEQYIP